MPPRRPGEMSRVDVRDADLASPERALSLFTVLAAISSAVPSDFPLFFHALLDVLVLTGSLRALLHPTRRHRHSFRRFYRSSPRTRAKPAAPSLGVGRTAERVCNDVRRAERCPSWPKERDWKSRTRRKLGRGFESRPLRLSAFRRLARGRVREIRDQIRELLVVELVAVRLRHDARREAVGDLGVGVDDRLANEVRRPCP